MSKTIDEILNDVTQEAWEDGHTGGETSGIGISIEEAKQQLTQLIADIIKQDIEMRGDIDDELTSFVPDIHERSLEVSGVPSSFTNLYTRSIVRSTQQAIRQRAKERGIDLK